MIVDALNLRAIVVYDTCGDDAAVDYVFSYARERGIEVVVPPNTLRERNSEHKRAKQ